MSDSNMYDTLSEGRMYDNNMTKLAAQIVPKVIWMFCVLLRKLRDKWGPTDVPKYF